jgi:hypothetical protein
MFVLFLFAGLLFQFESAAIPCPTSDGSSCSTVEHDSSTFLQSKARVAAGGSKEDDQSSVGLFIAADHRYLKMCRAQLLSLKCYADRHGYGWHVLAMDRNVPQRCSKLDYYFKQHCLAAEFLQKQPDGYTVFVMDSDVAAVNLHRNLDRWLDSDSDLQFYMRDGSQEVMSGAYLAKNSGFTRNFLMRLSSYQFRQPRGYSAWDNGPIHLVILHALRVDGGSRCVQLFTNLTQLQGDKGYPPQEYWNFVNCCLDAMGTYRKWRASSEDGVGNITIWPALNFAIADGRFNNFRVNPDTGPVFHHGVKKEQDVCAYYADVLKCEQNPKMLQFTAAEYKDFAMENRDSRCTQCTDKCVGASSCKPLGPYDKDGRARQAHIEIPLIDAAVTTSSTVSDESLTSTNLDANTAWNWEESSFDVNELLATTSDGATDMPPC